jgi:hypothetical protein
VEQAHEQDPEIGVVDGGTDLGWIGSTVRGDGQASASGGAKS